MGEEEEEESATQVGAEGGGHVLLELDFPRKKPQDPAVKQRNRALLEKYGVKGFPTILFLDADGKEVGRSGYKRGGPATWIPDAQKILDQAK